jgi:hypothetical protein
LSQQYFETGSVRCLQTQSDVPLTSYISMRKLYGWVRTLSFDFLQLNVFELRVEYV